MKIPRRVKTVDNIASERPNVHKVNHEFRFDYFMACKICNLCNCMM